MIKDFYENLDKMIPDPKCELDYNTGYELLIATMLSAQTTDKRVNIVTKNLFKYSLIELSLLNVDEIEKIIKSLGTSKRKAFYVQEIARNLIKDNYQNIPYDREYFENLPGVGRKTVNVVFSHLYNDPVIAVDTHVLRTSKILGLVRSNRNPLKVEGILNKKIPIDKRNKVGSQLVLFGRYICKAKKPDCQNCLFNKECKKTDKI